MTDITKKWEDLRDQYPPLEIPHDREERTAFENWVSEMGFDGLIALNGIKGQNDEPTN